MADTKISALPAIASIALEDLLAIVDDPSGVPVTTRGTFTQVMTLIASAVMTMTNKTFDADGTGNSITNIENADIKAAAAIALNKLAALTASIVPVANASGFLVSSSVTATELGYVSGVTSALQTQLNARVSLTGAETVDGKTLTGAVRIQNALGSALATTGTVDLDFSTNELVTMPAMTGNVTFTTSNLAAGRTKTIRIIGGASAYTLTFPVGWKLLGDLVNGVSVGIGKYAVLTITSISTTNAECVVAYAVEA